MYGISLLVSRREREQSAQSPHHLVPASECLSRIPLACSPWGPVWWVLSPPLWLPSHTPSSCLGGVLASPTSFHTSLYPTITQSLCSKSCFYCLPSSSTVCFVFKSTLGNSGRELSSSRIGSELLTSHCTGQIIMTLLELYTKCELAWWCHIPHSYPSSGLPEANQLATPLTSFPHYCFRQSVQLVDFVTWFMLVSDPRDWPATPFNFNLICNVHPESGRLWSILRLCLSENTSAFIHSFVYLYLRNTFPFCPPPLRAEHMACARWVSTSAQPHSVPSIILLYNVYVHVQATCMVSFRQKCT